MTLKISTGLDCIGLRLAKKHAKELIAEAKGDRSDFARGIRSGLRALMTNIDKAISDYRKGPSA